MTRMSKINDRYGLMLFGDTPRGTCPMCAVRHDPDQPHDQQSLTWQYKFYDIHGRWPTWKDAIAHCSPEVRSAWTEALRDYGIEVGGDDE